jgi:beta-xylosidase
VPATSDDFSSPQLGYQWQWQANPDARWAQLDPGSQTLRLGCVPLVRADSHWNAAHLLLQKFPAPGFTAEVSLSFAARNDGECAGLMIFGFDYAWLGLRRNGGRLQAVLAICENASAGASEQVAVLPEPTPAFDGRNFLGLRVEVGADALCQFALSWDGIIYPPVGLRFQARSSRWVGAKVGLFASATSACAEHGTASFQRFRVCADQGGVLR